MHSLNNVLYACCANVVATPASFHSAANDLTTRERNIHDSPVQYSNDRGFLIEVANKWLQNNMPCCRLQHSMSGEVGDGERVIGALVQPRDSGHFVCHRKPYDLRRWQRVDSLSARPILLPEDAALALSQLCYYVLHQKHDCTSIVDDRVSVGTVAAEAPEPASVPVPVPEPAGSGGFQLFLDAGRSKRNDDKK